MTLVTRPTMADDDGTFTSGTEVDKALLDDILDEIDDQAHSATNPTVKPKTITDEVVAARGSEASLDARLSVALEDDGTLKSQASLLSVSDLQAVLGSRNVVVNGDLDDWSAGDTSAPDNFTLTTLTIAKTGPGEADTFTFGAGRYAAKLTRAGADGNILQSVIAAADMADFINVRGQKFSAAVKAKSAIASHIRITVDDGVTTDSSTYHTGGGTEETLTVTHIISGAATKLEVLIEVKNSAGDAYWGGLVGVFAPYAPSDWQALSNEKASATRPGIIGTAAQDLPGIKSFTDGAPLFAAGGVGTNTARASGRLTGNTTYANVGNVGTGEDNLHSFSLLGGTLDNDGMALRITAWGTFAANGNTKQVKAYFGATVVVAGGAAATNGGQWRIEVEVIRTGAATQRAVGRYVHTDAAGAEVHTVLVTAPGETLSGAVTVKVTGESGAASDNDIVQSVMLPEVVG